MGIATLFKGDLVRDVDDDTKEPLQVRAVFMDDTVSVQRVRDGEYLYVSSQRLVLV